MSWNTFLSSAGVRSDRFNTYDDALKHFNAVKPIRGRTPELKPLGNNRAYVNCEIKHDPLTQTVSGHLYGEECFSIDADGVIMLSTGRWINPSTAAFIEACIPNKWGSVYLNRRKIILRTPDRKEYQIPKDGLFLQASTNWDTAEIIASQASVTNVKYDYVADRKVMNKLRKAYEPFLTMVNVMSAMSSKYHVNEYCDFFPEIPTKYIEAENEHNRQQNEAHATGKTTHRHSFHGAWHLKSIMQDVAGLPRMSTLPDLAGTISAYMDTDKTSEWLRTKAERILSDDIPRFMQALQGGLGDDAQAQRKIMLMIVANGNNYANGDGYGEQANMTDVPTLFGDVKLPILWYDVNGSQIENYFIDLIKYVYADKIFKKIEVPVGTMPKVTNNKYMVINEFLAKHTDIVTSRHVVL